VSIRRVILLTMLVACGPAAIAVPTGSPPATPAPSRAPIAALPTVLWTAPPGPAPTPSPTPTPAPAPLATEPPPAPAPRPAATVRVTPTPTNDPFRWTAYELSGGPVVYLPATWTTLDPVVSRGAFAFAASPEPPHPQLTQYVALMTMDWFSATPTLTLDAFANAYQAAIAFMHPSREPGTHPSGPAVFFTYRDQAGYQHVDAIVAGNGRIATLRMRAPIDRWAPYAPTFQQIVQRFRPG